jgi:hypothetical protein
MAVAASLLSRLCACRPYDVFFVRAYYVHASHARLGLYFSFIPCSVSFVIVRLPFWSFCSLLVFLLCASRREHGGQRKALRSRLALRNIAWPGVWLEVVAPLGASPSTPL